MDQLTEREQAGDEIRAKLLKLAARGDTALRTMLRELIVIDWFALQAGAPGPLGLIGQAAADRDLGPETRSWITELAASTGDDSGVENFDELPGARGSLGYALGMTDVVLSAIGGRPEALDSLEQLTGRDFVGRFRRLARGRGHPDENAAEDALSVLWELIAEIAVSGAEKGRRHLYDDQRAALAGTVDKAISDHVGGKRKPIPKALRKALPLDEETAAPADSSLTLEERIALSQVLSAAALTDRMREAISLRLQGLEGEALAAALGTGTSAAEKLCARAIKELRKTCKGHGGDF